MAYIMMRDDILMHLKCIKIKRKQPVKETHGSLYQA